MVLYVSPQDAMAVELRKIGICEWAIIGKCWRRFTCNQLDNC